MAMIINNNSFTIDGYGIRTTRLSLIEANIGDYAAELSLPAEMLNWAQNAAGIWQSKLSEHTYELGKRQEAFQTSQESDAALLERYNVLKELLISRYAGDKDALSEYGIDGATKKNHSLLINKSQIMDDENSKRLAAGDAKALPQTMIDTLAALRDGAYQNYRKALEQLTVSKAKTKQLRQLFDADSVQLRQLYYWAVAYWGKYDANLIALGFVESKTRSGARPAQPENLRFDDADNIFSWDAVDGATSYQLRYRDAGGKIWKNAYTGADVSVLFVPAAGSWLFCSRARNSNGYGAWSECLTVEK